MLRKTTILSCWKIRQTPNQFKIPPAGLKLVPLLRVQILSRKDAFKWLCYLYGINVTKHVKKFSR